MVEAARVALSHAVVEARAGRDEHVLCDAQVVAQGVALAVVAEDHARPSGAMQAAGARAAATASLVRHALAALADVALATALRAALGTIGRAAAHAVDTGGAVEAAHVPTRHGMRRRASALTVDARRIPGTAPVPARLRERFGARQPALAVVAGGPVGAAQVAARDREPVLFAGRGAQALLARPPDRAAKVAAAGRVGGTAACPVGARAAFQAALVAATDRVPVGAARVETPGVGFVVDAGPFGRAEQVVATGGSTVMQAASASSHA